MGKAQQRLKELGGIAAQAREPYVSMRDGSKVEFLNPKPEQIRIKDIAWSLAGSWRFNCHMNKFYSTAEHSILCAVKAPNREISKLLLIHDASEYVFADVASPVKRLIPEYKKMEGDFQDFIFKTLYRLPTAAEHEIMIDIDRRMCATEMRDLRNQSHEHVEAEPYDPLEVPFHCWKRRKAYKQYIWAFNNLFEEQAV